MKFVSAEQTSIPLLMLVGLKVTEFQKYEISRIEIERSELRKYPSGTKVSLESD